MPSAAFVSSASAVAGAAGVTSITCNKPSSTGGVLVALVTAIRGGGAVAIAEHADWDPVVEFNNGGALSVGLYVHEADAGDPASWTWNFDNTTSQGAQAHILRYSGVLVSDIVAAYDNDTNIVSSGNATVPGVDTDRTLGRSLRMFVQLQRDLTIGVPGGTTQRINSSNATGSAPNGTTLAISDHEITSGGPTGSAVFTTSGTSGTNAGITLVLKSTDGQDIVELTSEDSSHGHSAEEAALALVHPTTGEDSTHGHTADTAALVHVHALSAEDSTHSQTAEEAELQHVHVLAAEDCQHAQTAEEAALAEVAVLAAEDSTHGHVAEEAALTEVYELTAEECVHGHAVEEAAFVDTVELTAEDSAHGHTADEAGLEDGGPAPVALRPGLLRSAASGIRFTRSRVGNSSFSISSSSRQRFVRPEAVTPQFSRSVASNAEFTNG